MPRHKTKRALTLLFSFVLSGSLLQLHPQGAEAQATGTAPAPAAPAPAVPATPAPAKPAATVAVPPSAPPAVVPAAPAALPMVAAPAPVIRVSMIGLVKNSDPVVQSVMLFLLLCSAGSWAAFFYKSITLVIARRNTNQFSEAFQSARTMDDADKALAPVGDGAARRMWLAAKQEWDATLRITHAPLAADQTSRLLQRLALTMGSAQERSLSRLGNWMGLLATIGSTAPFIGLFGTVWGILDSFEHISASYNTSLTVVAPGIAEALLATAAGLFAAIPATMFYNRFAREVGKITGMLDNVTADLVVFASRDVERLGK